jgi:hypothetical protein
MSPAPVGTNIVGLSLGHSWGDVLLDKTLPVGDLDGGFSVLVPSYSRFFSLLGATTRFSAAIPVATGNWDALVETDSVETDISRTGFADAVASMTVFLLGAPSMTPEEFRDYRRRTILGFNLRLKVPIGQYDSERLVNLGSNRWQVAPALALSHWIGDFTLEAYAGMWAFSDNTSQLGDNVLSQDPLFAFQLNAGYSLRPHLWLSAGVRQTAGGETTVNGVAKDNAMENTRLGIVLGIPIVRGHTLKLLATTGLRGTAGTDFNTLVAQWFFAW